MTWNPKTNKWDVTYDGRIYRFVDDEDGITYRSKSRAELEENLSNACIAMEDVNIIRIKRKKKTKKPKQSALAKSLQEAYRELDSLVSFFQQYHPYDSNGRSHYTDAGISEADATLQRLRKRHPDILGKKR